MNQIDFGPTLYDGRMLAGHAERGIAVEGYSGLKNTKLGDPVLAKIAAAHGVTTAQVVLRWHLEHGVTVIPKSSRPERIATNFDLFGFSLTPEQVASIDATGPADFWRSVPDAGIQLPASTGFLPSRDAFAFTNTWPAAPALVVPAPLRPVGIGNAARGLCGGMVFGALDYWHAGSRAAGHPARAGLAAVQVHRPPADRLLAAAVGVAGYYGWMSLPDADIRLRRGGDAGGAAIRGVRQRSVSAQWPRIRTVLDRESRPRSAW